MYVKEHNAFWTSNHRECDLEPLVVIFVHAPLISYNFYPTKFINLLWCGFPMRWEKIHIGAGRDIPRLWSVRTGRGKLIDAIIPGTIEPLCLVPRPQPQKREKWSD